MVILKLANKSLKHSYGVVEDALVKIEKIIFPIDFVVLDIDDILLILGRLFLAIGRTIIDVVDGTLPLNGIVAGKSRDY